jgi:hypothetical protein
MQLLVQRDREPITPLVYKVRSWGIVLKTFAGDLKTWGPDTKIWGKKVRALFQDLGVSSTLVIGGSGELRGGFVLNGNLVQRT